MKVHHLNCGTMNFPGLAMVTHVLLVETNAGLVLVDSGHGLLDCADPAGRLGAARFLTRPLLDVEETAARQVERLGFARTDVRHVVLTHFDYDHIGGLADFPHAQVHVTAAEVDGAVRAPSWRERSRFRSAQWAHGPDLVEYAPVGESWRGFEAVRELQGLDGFGMLFLPGHTRGHAAVVVETGDRTILHCGDAFQLQRQLDEKASVPRLAALEERLIAYDYAQVLANHARLGELWREAEEDLLVVNSHDPALLERARRS